MTHYVLLKLAPGADAQAVYERVAQTYQALGEALPWKSSPAVYRSCVERDTNADIMAVIRLDSPAQLPEYLNHPLHLAMARDLKDSLAGRTSFDHE